MAKKIKFHFNPDTLNYEPVVQSIATRTKQILLHLFSGISLGALFFFVFVSTFDSPEAKQLSLEKSRMQAQYKVLEKQLKNAQAVMSDLQERDNNLYRVIFEAEPIPAELRRATIANTNYYEQLLKMTNSELVSLTTKKMDEIRKQIYMQSKSFDELIKLTKNKNLMLESIPAIQPVMNKDLKRMASGYGWRIDPVYRSRRFHAGMDFAAPSGTDIFATGSGTVVASGWQQGYGNCVQVSHGYGYLTLYGHMSKIKVQKGQKVKRGQVIGLVGNTGKSTGPHLHYEVHLRGNVMDPRNFYYLDLSPADYDRMIQMSENSGQMMD
ncbi:MAG: peptidase M23 [Porphyromonadaceae bacterium CG2_30_38_12]|nr:MAG: peptidase M23 [Porphyromonadaceae bacterium CG2_30_38_12]